MSGKIHILRAPRFSARNITVNPNGTILLRYKLKHGLDARLAHVMIRSTRWSWLNAWAMQIAKRRGMKKGNRSAGSSLGCDHASHLE
jgi:hypothetical protein